MLKKPNRHISQLKQKRKKSKIMDEKQNCLLSSTKPDINYWAIFFHSANSSFLTARSSQRETSQRACGATVRPRSPSQYLDVLLFISVFKGFVQEHTKAPSCISWTNHSHHSLDWAAAAAGGGVTQKKKKNRAAVAVVVARCASRKMIST